MKNPEQTERQTGYFYLLIFIFLAAGIVTGGYFAYRNYEKNYRSEEERQLSAIADLKVDQLVQWRKERLGDAIEFYKNNVFSDLVKRYFKNQADADAKRRIQAWMGQNSTENIYNRICLHDIVGTERIFFPEGKIHAPFIFSLRSAEVLKSGKVEFQDFYRDENDKKVYLNIIVPILDEYDNRKTLGILALRIDPTQYLYPMIEKWPTLSKTSETLIIRRDGNDVLFLNNLKFYKDAALNLRIPLERKDILEVKAVLDIKGVVEGRDYRGEHVVGVVCAVPDSPWFLVARMDMEEVNAPLRERLWLMIVLVGALLVGVGTIGGLVFRYQRASLYASRRNEEQIRIFNEQQQKILDASPIMIFYKDKENRFIRVNEALARTNGKSKEEMEGKTCWDLYSWEAADHYWQDDKEVISAGQSKLNIVESMETPKGMTCVESSKIPYRDSTGSIIGIVGFTQDITERKKIEAGLEKTRKELVVIKKSADEASEFAESVINTVREPLISLDQDLRVVTVSHSFYDFFKVKPEETVGQLIYDLGNKQWDIPKLRELLETILPQKASFNNYEVEHDFATIGRRTMLLNARQIQRTSKTNERIILLAIEDITERKEIEAGLEKTRKELAVIKKTADEASEFAESVINTVREPLISLDQDLRVITVSRSFYDFFKVKPEETVGQHIYDLGNKQWDIPKLRELLENILPQKASFDNYEVEHDFATIGRRTMLLNARQIQRTSKTNERIILLAIEDITERKEIEAGLEKTRKELVVTNKELEAFSYSVSHDLRAPLRHISGYVELLVKHFQSELSEKGVHYLDSIEDSAHQMGKLIDTLLQFSRTGRVEMHRSQMEMSEIVQEVVESVSKDNPDRTIEWVVRKLPSVSGDDLTLRLVWMNLLSNAAKFTRTRENALIEIGAKDEIKEVIFFVRDNGVGFDMKYAQKLFGVFQRLHPSEEFEGTGIGLANVNRIVMRHGGRAWAEAELNKGATFYFSIPKY
jgi:PAS domain S-box-containing protein